MRYSTEQKKNKTASFDGITSVRAWTIIPHNARVFVYHAALWQAVVVVCAQMDTVDRKAMQIHRDELSYFNFRYVSVLIFPSFHIKYASENSCRMCVTLLESLEQWRRSNVAQNQTTLPSTYPSRKHKNLKQMKPHLRLFRPLDYNPIHLQNFLKTH